jgi:hypothetical protein
MKEIRQFVKPFAVCFCFLVVFGGTFTEFSFDCIYFSLCTCFIWSRDSSVGIATRLRAGRSGI